MVQPPQFIRSFFPSVTWRINENEKVLYLSFDDGPHPQITVEVLSILKSYNAKATFFCIGKNVEKYPAIYAQILNEGHATGNHTYQHLDAWKVSRKKYIDDIKQASGCIPSGLFRPPYGKLTPAIIRALKTDYRIILWDVISYDFDANVSKEQVLQNVLIKPGPGSVIVFHDSEKAYSKMIFALPLLLRSFTAEGYRFKAIV